MPINSPTLTRLYAPSYETYVFNCDTLPKIVEQVKKELDKLATDCSIDAVAGSGFSGTILLGALSVAHKIPILAIRKDNERHHSNRDAVGYLIKDKVDNLENANFWRTEEKDPLNYVIVDDLVSTGATVKRIHTKIKKKVSFACCKAIMLYAWHEVGSLPETMKIDDLYDPTPIIKLSLPTQ